MAADLLVVMAAGRGTRMDPLTRTRPKVLLPVAGRPLAEHVVAAARRAGFRRALMVVHAGAGQVQRHFGDGSALDLELDYVRQAQPRGTGHAVATVRGHVDEDFVVVSGDSVVDAADLKRLRAANGVAVGGRRVEDIRPYGSLAVRDGRVAGVREKPKRAGPGIANAGCYRFTPEVVARARRLQPSARGELEITDTLAALARDGEPARFVEVPSWREAGRPWDLLDLQAHLMASQRTRVAGDVGERVDIEGSVVVEDGARIQNGTRIEGPVLVQAGARVGPNAYLRPATAIGPGCHVGASVEVKNSILGANTHVPHLSYVGDSVLGNDCNLGAGTQVANLKHSPRPVRVLWQGKEWLDTGRRKLGVIVGDDVKTGVNCSLNPGTVLCPGVRLPAGQAVSGWVEAEPL